MESYIWKLKKEKLVKTNLFKYLNFVKKNINKDINTDFNSIWEWSIKNPGIFWKSIWDFTKVKGEFFIQFPSNSQPLIYLEMLSRLISLKCSLPTIFKFLQE